MDEYIRNLKKKSNEHSDTDSFSLTSLLQQIRLLYSVDLEDNEILGCSAFWCCINLSILLRNGYKFVVDIMTSHLERRYFSWPVVVYEKRTVRLKWMFGTWLQLSTWRVAAVTATVTFTALVMCCFHLHYPSWCMDCSFVIYSQYVCCTSLRMGGQLHRYNANVLLTCVGLPYEWYSLSWSYHHADISDLTDLFILHTLRT